MWTVLRLPEEVDQGGDLNGRRHDSEDDRRPQVASGLSFVFLQDASSNWTCTSYRLALATHGVELVQHTPRVDPMRPGIVTLAMFALGVAACEPPTAPELLVYADRAVTVPTSAQGWKAVTVGGSHSCGLRLDGALYCWGGNSSAQLGIPSARGSCGSFHSPCEAGPRAAQTAERFSSVRAGQRHSCAISTARTLYCWGENYTFETGVQALVLVTVPTPVLPDMQFIDVGPGMSHTCAVRTNGVVYCWGDGSYGALGRGDTITSVIPKPIASGERFVLARSGRQRSCAIALDGAAWCWGLEWESSQGNVDIFHQRLLPHRLDGLPPLRDISINAASTCALTIDDISLCWESNGFAQLGDGTTTGTATPVLVATSERFSNVSTGIIQSCATAHDGRAFCWGNNTFGQLGVPRPGDRCASLECSRLPIGVFGHQRFTTVATGFGTHTCGITVDTSILCWGLGSDGQLGDGYTRDRQSLPVGVLAPSP
jgi:alpha-tubulin suppressor-like RCC1 family protein